MARLGQPLTQAGSPAALSRQSWHFSIGPSSLGAGPHRGTPARRCSSPRTCPVDAHHPVSFGDGPAMQLFRHRHRRSGGRTRRNVRHSPRPPRGCGAGCPGPLRLLPCHPGRSLKGAVVLAQMAPQAPLFPHVDSFHTAPPSLSGVFDAEHPQLGVREAHTPEHQPVAPAPRWS